MTKKKRSIMALFSALIPVMLHATHVSDVSAELPETLIRDDVISVQVSGGESGSSSPYTVPGESLIHLIGQVVDFQREGANLLYHRPTGKLFVKNTPHNIEHVKSLLEELRNYTPEEVLIEARIVEIVNADGLDFGVNLKDASFTAIWTGESATVGFNETPADLTNFAPGSWDTTGQTLTLAQANEFNVLGFFNHPKFNVDLALQALSQKLDITTLSAPRISCFNNQRANIRVVRTQSYISDYDVSLQTSGDTVQPVQNPVISEADSGIDLDIIPTIDATRNLITLEFHPTIIELDLQPTQVDLGSGDVDISFPDFTTRSLDTTVTLPNGGTVVIGGLMNRAERSDTRKVPFLGDIPLLGNLFKSKTTFDLKKNLVFFITAKTKGGKEPFF